MILLDGRKTRDALVVQLVERIKALGRVPTLAIIQVGSRPDSTAFIRAKKAFAKRIGINEKHIQIPEAATQGEVIDLIKQCNKDQEVTGIVVQLPLPSHMDRDLVIDAIDVRKDVDGLTKENVKLWLEGSRKAILPATARGVRELLKFYDISLAGKKVAVIGRSMLVGKPIASMCLNENATVDVCHRGTLDIRSITKNADIIISAAGKPGLVTKDNVKPGQVVVDVGITRTSENKLVGDVDFDAVKDIVLALSPVPGGVGPMTVLALFENLLDLV